MSGLAFYTEEEIKNLGYTLNDCVSKEIKGVIFYILKKDL